jgi:hypothetical protein
MISEMSAAHHRPATEQCKLSATLSAEWQALCEHYLPLSSGDSIWRYSRAACAEDPEQGWKLHVSATVLTAVEVLKKIAPLLRRRRILFKAPGTLEALGRLNCGLIYGCSQIGKVITVYPRTTEEAVRLARLLHKSTHGTRAPSVPYDLKFRPGSCVHYRYGSFRRLEMTNTDGSRMLAIRNPEGELVPDLRDAETAHPAWVADPFALKHQTRGDKQRVERSPLNTRFRAFRALWQRGRGGVYLALDSGASPRRLCILKEGRRDGEVSWDGRDGHWRVKHEAEVLTALNDAGLSVPLVYATFEVENNLYLAMELVEGESLQSFLGRRKRRLPVRVALGYARRLAELISRIHAAGWVWRDCKPANVILTRDGALRPLDFEGSCPLAEPDPQAWGTHSYVAPEWLDEFHGQSRQPEDLYALGACAYYLLAGRPPDLNNPTPLSKLRRGVPRAAQQLIAALLDPDPARRPDAATAARRLKEAEAAPPARAAFRAASKARA